MNQPNSVCSVIFSPRVIANMDSVDIVMELVLHGDLSSLIRDAPFCMVPYDVPFDRFLTFTTAELQARRVIVNLCDALQVLLMSYSMIWPTD
jgi:hypothetical protein